MPAPARAETARDAETARRSPRRVERAIAALFPALAPLFEQGYDRYNDSVDRLLKGGDNQGRVWEEIAPPYPLKTDSWTVGAQEIGNDYRLGVETALNWWAHKVALD